MTTTPYDLTPPAIVAELDRFIVGQDKAKKAVAIALRNRWRRAHVDEAIRDEITPKNILMIGPTGVGKTEIARRLAKLAGAPFIKVEATKFTEVGYVGRDVEQIIRDLVEIALSQEKDKHRAEVRMRAETLAEERILSALVGDKAHTETREKFRTQLQSGALEHREIDIEVQDNTAVQMPTFDVPGMPGAQMGMMNLGDIFGKALGGRTKTRQVSIADARPLLIGEEADKLIDQEKIVETAIRAVENNGIVFLDEVDKICGRSQKTSGEVSREGVQRDLLPLLEGSSVSTKYGTVKTDHILFIASGAFHVAKPSDLLPELQGRLPIRVELNPLAQEDFVRILTEPEANLIRQYTALLATEGVTLTFDQSAIDEIAQLAAHVNQTIENIGARRLQTIMEKLLEDISFTAANHHGQRIHITGQDVQTHVTDLAKNADLSRFIL